MVGRLFCFLFGFVAFAAPPIYTVSSIVNAASNLPGPLTPYGIYTIYGDNLATATVSSGPVAGQLPVNLGPGSLRVLIDGSAAGLYYVSPHQVNFLVPANLSPGTRTITVTRDGIAGPSLRIPLQAAAPALFSPDGEIVSATHANGRVISADSPAQPAEVIVVYATGLGSVSPPILPPLAVASQAGWIKQPDQCQLLLNGEVIYGSVFYAGVTPGFAGLYQINVRLPDNVAANPEIRISVGGEISPSGLFLPVARSAPDSGSTPDHQNATIRSRAAEIPVAPSPAEATRDFVFPRR